MLRPPEINGTCANKGSINQIGCGSKKDLWMRQPFLDALAHGQRGSYCRSIVIRPPLRTRANAAAPFGQYRTKHRTIIAMPAPTTNRADDVIQQAQKSNIRQRWRQVAGRVVKDTPIVKRKNDPRQDTLGPFEIKKLEKTFRDDRMFIAEDMGARFRSRLDGPLPTTLVRRFWTCRNVT